MTRGDFPKNRFSFFIIADKKQNYDYFFRFHFPNETNSDFIFIKNSYGEGVTKRKDN